MSSMERIDSPVAFQRLIGFWRWTPDTRVFFADAAVCALFSIDPAIGRTGDTTDRFDDNIHRDDRQFLFQRISNKVAAGLDFAERYRVIDADRQIRSVLTLGRRFEGKTFAAPFYVGALFDVDEGSPEISPSYAALIDYLLATKSLADSLNETMLARLVEAVLLEAGLCYAKALQGKAD